MKPIKLSKYEYARIISIRSQELSLGARQTTQCDSTDPYIIAQKEFQEGKIPYKIVRNYPDGESKSYFINDFENK